MAERPSMPAIYAALAEDEARNDLIFNDVLKSLEAKRSPIVLTERKDHLEYLKQRFSRFAKNIVVLRGGMSAKDRKAAHAALNVDDDEERLILATGRYIGEGFDDARLDALFLTMPIAWKGTLAQYVGRWTVLSTQCGRHFEGIFGRFVRQSNSSRPELPAGSEGLRSSLISSAMPQRASAGRAGV